MSRTKNKMTKDTGLKMFEDPVEQGVLLGILSAAAGWAARMMMTRKKFRTVVDCNSLFLGCGSDRKLDQAKGNEILKNIELKIIRIDRILSAMIKTVCAAPGADVGSILRAAMRDEGE